MFRKKGQTHIAEITRPILRALLSNPQLDLDLEFALAEDLQSASLIYILRFASNQDRQSRRAIVRDEQDVHLCRFERPGEILS